MSNKVIEKIGPFPKEIRVVTTGVPIVIGSVITAYMVTEHFALESFPTQTMLVHRVLDEGYSFEVDTTVAGQENINAKAVAAIHEQHFVPCPQSCTYSLLEADVTTEDPILSVEIGGSAITLPNFPYAATQAGALLLQTDLRAYFAVNHPAGVPDPYITVTLDEAAAPDEWNIIITGSILVVDSINGGGDADSDFVQTACAPVP